MTEPTDTSRSMAEPTDAAPAGPRIVRAPRGTEISCRGWLQEAALRMLMNNLDPEVAEEPDRLVVYGGRGQAAGERRGGLTVGRDTAGVDTDRVAGRDRPQGDQGGAERHPGARPPQVSFPPDAPRSRGRVFPRPCPEYRDGWPVP